MLVGVDQHVMIGHVSLVVRIVIRHVSVRVNVPATWVGLALSVINLIAHLIAALMAIVTPPITVLVMRAGWVIIVICKVLGARKSLLSILSLRSLLGCGLWASWDMHRYWPMSV